MTLRLPPLPPYLPSPSHSLSLSLLLIFAELYLLADLFFEVISPYRGLSQFVTDRFISPPLSRKEAEGTFSFEVFLPASNSYLSSLNPHIKTAQLSSNGNGSRTE